MYNSLLSKYVKPGNRMDIRAVRGSKSADGQEAKIYQSQIYDIISEDRIEVVMPMEKTKYVLLPIGREYDVFFYTDNAIYQCRVKIADREKRNNTYLLIMDILSNLRKDQRREFYRFSCALEMNTRELQNEEIEMLNEKMADEEVMMPMLPLKRSIIVDISGGGLRFVSDHSYDEGSTLMCRYQLDTENGIRVYENLGRVLSVREIENKPGVYEHRVKYVNIDNEAREDIIKFIFEEERKHLKKKD